MDDNIWRNLLASALKDAWKTELYTDLEIVVDDGSMKAHKVVLASTSPYFRALLSADLSECRSNTLNLRGFDLRTLEATLNYIYCGCALLTEENALDILSLADYFQIHALKKLCCSYLKRRLRPSNCLPTYELARLHRCHDLAQSALKVALDSCSDAVQDPSFLELQPETLFTLLKQPVLKIHSEDELFKGVMQWYSSNISYRAQWLPSLLSLLKAPQLDPMGQILLRERLEELQCQYPIPAPERLGSERPMKAFRHMNEEELLLVTGGEGKGPIYSHSECFAVGYSSWKSSVPSADEGKKSLNNLHDINEGGVIPPMSTSRSYAAVATINNILYLIGGLSSESFLNTCECYDITKNRWESLPPVPEPFHAGGAAFLEGVLCVLGGKTTSKYEDSLLTLDFRDMQWRYKGARLATPRAHFGVATLNDCLFAVAGLTGERRGERVTSRFLTSCEKYDKEADSWVPIAPLCYARAYHSVAVVEDALYAIGGYNGSVWLNSVEKYDPFTNKWTPVSPMITTRSSFGVTVSLGRIYCIGGFGGNTVLNSVEKYNPRTDTWHCVQSMRFRRMGVSAVTLKLPREMILSAKSRRAIAENQPNII